MRNDYEKAKDRPDLFCKRCCQRFHSIGDIKRHLMYPDFCESCGDRFNEEHYNKSI